MAENTLTCENCGFEGVLGCYIEIGEQGEHVIFECPECSGKIYIDNINY